MSYWLYWIACFFFLSREHLVCYIDYRQETRERSQTVMILFNVNWNTDENMYVMDPLYNVFTITCLYIWVLVELQSCSNWFYCQALTSVLDYNILCNTEPSRDLIFRRLWSPIKLWSAIKLWRSLAFTLLLGLQLNHYLKNCSCQRYKCSCHHYRLSHTLINSTTLYRLYSLVSPPNQLAIGLNWY